MVQVPFVKMHGAGNDFVILDEHTGSVKDWAAVARTLCPRRFGIGADTLVVVDRQRYAATFFNADGSRAEICGNALRCVAHLLTLRGDVAGPIEVQTDAGRRRCKVDDLDRAGGTASVRVEMGPVEILEEADGYPRRVDLDGIPVSCRALRVGNPHLVVLRSPTAGEVERLGPGLSAHAAFAAGTNVEWVDILDEGHLRVAVYERGVGPTLACGSGACASAAAAVLEGRSGMDREIEVELPGGVMGVTIDGHWRAELVGPSRMVFEGSVRLP